MPRYYFIGIAGCIGLIAALFSPVLDMPALPPLNFHDISAAKSIGLIILALLSIGLIIFDKPRWLLLTASLCLVTILYSLKRLYNCLNFPQEQVTSTLNGLSVTGIGEPATHLKWGWLALLISVGLMLLAAVSSYIDTGKKQA